MCARCPFRPDGTGYARDHADFSRILASVEIGASFYCHETVVLDPRTTLDETGDVPEPQFQEHFEICRGAHEHYMNAWEKRALSIIAAREAAKKKEVE
jgi:hypothetical protein